MARRSLPSQSRKLRAAAPEGDVEATDEMFADELAASRRSVPRLTLALLVAIAVSLVFLGGVQAQKHWGASDGATSTGLPQGLSAGGPAAGFGGLGSTASPTEGTSSSTGEQGSTTTPAVVGTVTKVRAQTWVVTDLGGSRHTVMIGKETTLTAAANGWSDPVQNGSTVSVVGKERDDGSIAASAITVR